MIYHHVYRKIELFNLENYIGEQNAPFEGYPFGVPPVWVVFSISELSADRKARDSMSNRKKKEQMYALVGEWEQSGQTREAFCKAHGVSLGTFAYWRSKYQEEQSMGTASFIELDTGITGSIEITYPNGVVVKLLGESSLSKVRALIGVSSCSA